MNYSIYAITLPIAITLLSGKVGSFNRADITCYFKEIDNNYRVHLIPSQKEVWIPSSLVRVEKLHRALHLPNEYEGVISVPSWVKQRIDNGTFISNKPKPPQLMVNGKEVEWIHCTYKILKNSVLCDGNFIPRKFIHDIQSDQSGERPLLGRSSGWHIEGKLLVENWIVDRIKNGSWG